MTICTSGPAPAPGTSTHFGTQHTGAQQDKHAILTNWDHGAATKCIGTAQNGRGQSTSATTHHTHTRRSGGHRGHARGLHRSTRRRPCGRPCGRRRPGGQACPPPSRRGHLEARPRCAAAATRGWSTRRRCTKFCTTANSGESGQRRLRLEKQVVQAEVESAGAHLYSFMVNVGHLGAWAVAKDMSLESSKLRAR